MSSLSHRDQAVLDWFFSEGQTLLVGSSSFGHMLERAALYGDIEAPRVADASVTCWPDVLERQRYQPTSETNDTALYTFGRVSRQLSRLAERSPGSVRVLEAVHGDVGARWSTTREGSIGALYAFTAPGRRLIAKVRRASAQLTLSESKRFENSVLTAEPMTVTNMRLEARRLYQSACEAWNAAGDRPWTTTMPHAAE